MRKVILVAHYIYSRQKTARENRLYSKNETVLKISKNGHYAKAAAFALKVVSLAQKLKFPKNRTLLEHYTCSTKKRFEKTANMCKIRRF